MLLIGVAARNSLFQACFPAFSELGKVGVQEGDDSDSIVALVAIDMQKQGATLPRSTLEFLVQWQSLEAVKILEPLWVAQPVAGESILVDVGAAAEAAALRHLESDERGLQHSSIRILKRVGGSSSIEPLRGQLEGADDETRLLLQEVIESLEAAQ